MRIITRSRRLWMWILIPVLFLSACQKQDLLYRESFPLFGTLVEIQVWGSEPGKVKSTMDAVQKDFAHMHRDWHAWRPGMLTDLNRKLAAGQEAAVDPFLLPLLKQSVTLYRSSGGLFNPAIGRLIALWGFHSDTLPTGPPPDQGEIQALVAKHPGMDDLEINGNHVRSRNRFVQIDLGGIGKGAAVDAAIERMRAAGIRNAMVNAGGDLCAIGRKGSQFWRVGIASPRGQGLLASVELSGDECVFTSGTYARYRRADDKHYAHIIDPRDGWPVEHVVSVTVINDNGTVADAAATALAIAGPEKWKEVATRMGIHHVLLVDSQQRIQITSSLLNRVHFEDPKPKNVQVVTLE